MILLVSGVALIVASGALLWYMKPRDGKAHRLATMPLLDSMIPITITCGAAFGVAMIVAGAFQ